VPGLRGALPAHARASVLHGDRGGGPGTRRAGARGRAGLGEALAAWGLLGLELTATIVTYWRVAPSHLYHVDEAGDLAGGLSRGLTLVNYPHALAAIPLAAVAGGPRALVWACVALCLLIVVPGVLDQDDLDARLVNVVPALGVAIALALTLVAVLRGGAAFVPQAYGDRLRLVLAAGLLLLSLPWLPAEAGFYFPGDVFLGEEVPSHRDPGIAAVHIGVHHGFGGVLLALTALLLSRVPAGRNLRAYLSLILAYGLALAIQDTWNEQLWKRGTVDWEIPGLIRPDLAWTWLAIVLGAVAIYVLWFRPAKANGLSASAGAQPSSASSSSRVS
jgi:hypothetical protein